MWVPKPRDMATIKNTGPGAGWLPHVGESGNPRDHPAKGPEDRPFLSPGWVKKYTSTIWTLESHG